jgi:hypothetical protein
MADETTTTWADLLREAKGPLVEALRWKTVLLSELQRDKSPRRWHGKQITVPIYLAPQQGGGAITQTGTLNTPLAVDTDQAVINSAVLAIPISFSTQVIKQAQGDENSWAQVIPSKMERAEEAFKRLINEQMVGSGALIAAVTATNNNSTTITVGTTANFYQLYPGRVVDVLTRSNGAAITDGAGQKIVSYSKSAGTITVTTAMTTTNTAGLYIQGSYGNALQGLGDASATTGTFQGINKANVVQWQGTDASPAAASDPSISVLDRAERLVHEKAGRSPNFYLSDPAVVDKYSQGLTVQARWAGEEGQLKSGWSGIRYRDKVLVPEFDMPASTMYGVPLEDMALYTLDDGPDWDDMTGSMFQRFGTRALPVEAWLVWMLQLGFHNCNGIVKIGSLNQAA